MAKAELAKQIGVEIEEARYVLSRIRILLESSVDGMTEEKLEHCANLIRGVRGVIHGCKRIAESFDDVLR